MNHSTHPALGMLIGFGATLSLFFFAGLVMAQTTSGSQHWLPTDVSGDISLSAVTKSGGQVVSLPCDPMMSLKQEQALTDALLKESTLSWESGTPLTKITDDLSEFFPISLDRRALEEIGLDPDIAADSPLRFTGVGSQTSVKETRKAKWWQQESKSKLARRPSVVVDILTRLRDLDLTLMIRQGHVVITTREAAEEDLATRIYDITPMVSLVALSDVSRDRTWRQRGNTISDSESLMSTIESTIDTDTWEALGGPSKMVPSHIRDRVWLAISAPTLTHWKIQRLLDQLNR